ncbi:unnamed protein product [Ilex paraguariensis]|uniref:Uncharacterized protein n=1 Tax=Ilex paraguariensis TaxID=185542 RepID=A0ABC8U063_9AQUA
MKDSGAKRGRGMGEGERGIQGNPNANYVRLGDANGASRSKVADDDHGCSIFGDAGDDVGYVSEARGEARLRDVLKALGITSALGYDLGYVFASGSANDRGGDVGSLSRNSFGDVLAGGGAKGGGGLVNTLGIRDARKCYGGRGLGPGCIGNATAGQTSGAVVGCEGDAATSWCEGELGNVSGSRASCWA